MKKPTKKQLQEWEKWLSERPENVRKVAERLVPWKKYRDKRITQDVGNRYIPVSFDECENEKVTVTCAKINDEFPFFGGYAVFGIDPDDLIESN